MSAREADFGVEISKGAIAMFIMAAIGFAGSVIFARILGPAGYGTFYIVITIARVLDNPVTGWGIACKKRISESDFPLNEAFGSALIGAAIAPLVLLGFVVLFQRYTNFYDLSGMFIPFAVFFVAICFFEVSLNILTSRANFADGQWADMLRSIFTTPLQLSFVLLGFGAIGMVYGVAIATILSAPYVVYQIGIRPAVPSRKSLISIGTYAKYSIPNKFIGTAQSRVDILMLGALLTSAAVGEYQVAMQLTIPGTFLGVVTSQGLMARISESWSRNDEESATTDITNSIGYASSLAIPLFFGAAAMPNDLLITIFGDKFSGIGLVLVGLGLFQIVSTQTSQLGSTIAGVDRPDIGFRVGGTVLVLNVVLGYLLLLEYGLIGVVVATVIAETFKYICYIYIVKQYLPGLQAFPEPLRHQFAAGLVMFLIVDRSHALLSVSWWGELGFLVVLGAFVYFTLLVAVSEPFRTTVRGILSDALD